MIVLSVFIYILSLYAILLFHEGIHLFCAKILGYKPVLVKISPWAFKVSYKNKHIAIDNLIIAIMPAIVLIIIGIIIPLNYWTFILKLACLINFVNLLPITGDGEMIFLSIFQILKS